MTGYLDTYRSRPRLDLPSLLAQYGLEWHRRPFEALSGALLRVGGDYHIVTNNRHSWARQRFTAAHELKHYLTDRCLTPVFSCRRHVDTGMEGAANAFARELLMPPEVVRWLWDRGFRSAAEIGRALGVSAEAAGYRMRELAIGEIEIGWD
jgi:hypothetical protein